MYCHQRKWHIQEWRLPALCFWLSLAYEILKHSKRSKGLEICVVFGLTLCLIEKVFPVVVPLGIRILLKYKAIVSTQEAVKCLRAYWRNVRVATQPVACLAAVGDVSGEEPRALAEFSAEICWCHRGSMGQASKIPRRELYWKSSNVQRGKTEDPELKELGLYHCGFALWVGKIP